MYKYSVNIKYIIIIRKIVTIEYRKFFFCPILIFNLCDMIVSSTTLLRVVARGVAAGINKYEYPIM